jgi:hypothetical protein
MSRRTIATYAAVAAFALASGPALGAQDRPNPGSQSSGSAGARPNSGGGNSGSAVSRPSGGGSSGGSTSSSSGSSGSSRGSSASGFTSGGDSDGYRPARPERRPEARTEGSRAVPRSGQSATSGDRRRVAPGDAAASAGDNADPRRRAVPTYARPRDGRTVTGSAIDRRLAPPTYPGGIYVNPYYRYNYYYNRYPYGYYWPAYGFGLGYFYDPWMWGYGPGNYYDPYYYGGYGGGGGTVRYREGEYRPVGSLRLKVQPREAQVYVDGYYVGEVDSFDGMFQKLTIEEGAHRIEIRATGFETAQFEVIIIPGETITYKGDMKRMQ